MGLEFAYIDRKLIVPDPHSDFTRFFFFLLFIKPVKVEFSLSLGRNALSEMMIVHIFRFHNGVDVCLYEVAF